MTDRDKCICGRPLPTVRTSDVCQRCRDGFDAARERLKDCAEGATPAAGTPVRRLRVVPNQEKK